MKNQAEIVVIGSGFGGAIAAKRLADAGRDVLMLERGPWRDTVPNRSTGLENLAPLPQGKKVFTHGLRSIGSHRLKKFLLLNKKGFIEVFSGKGINIICSSSVGGGSHIYAAMLAKPSDPDYWANRHPLLSKTAMDNYYAEILDLLNARAANKDDRVPNDICQTSYEGTLSTQGLANPFIGILLPANPGTVEKVVDTNGVTRWECEYKNNSILGSPSGAKTTLDFSVVWPAIRSGLVVRDMCEVKVIHRLQTSEADAMRYEIHYRNHHKATNECVRARHVILAAGCLNTVRLLMHSRNTSAGLQGMPRLGKGFGTNGGYFGFWRENSTLDLSTGLPLSGPFRVANSTSRSVQVLRAAIQGLDDIPCPAFLKRWLRKNTFIVALGKDNNNGVMTLNRGKFSVLYNKKDSHVYQEIDNEVSEIRIRTGTKIYSPSEPVTVQPLGGASLGNSNQDGVIGANGEVFDNPGLYIADAAALPESPGRPPSLTIAAWAANVADRLLDTLKKESLQ
ncbi:GMC family oxidoreductase N-terminal domain-containing protein [Yokenella regensburgei]|uniref:GMC oxidoreductase n=1 Tax=Yokenella regensburgei TaxID=158877 RepID=UPI003F17D7BD